MIQLMIMISAQDEAYTVMADAASSLTRRLVSDSTRGNSSRIFVALWEPAGFHTVHSADASAYTEPRTHAHARAHAHTSLMVNFQINLV